MISHVRVWIPFPHVAEHGPQTALMHDVSQLTSQTWVLHCESAGAGCWLFNEQEYPGSRTVESVYVVVCIPPPHKEEHVDVVNVYWHSTVHDNPVHALETPFSASHGVPLLDAGVATVNVCVGLAHEQVDHDPTQLTGVGGGGGGGVAD